MTTFTARHYRTGLPVRVSLEGDRIAAAESLPLPHDELPTMPFVGPGLFDIQVNGYHGLWFGSETLTVDEVIRIVQALADRGIAGCFPTLITSSFEAMRHGVQTVREASRVNEIVGKVVRGIHLEGPYISSQDGPRGAHPLKHVRPADAAEFERWQKAAEGAVRLVTVAPEGEGVIPFIREISRRDVVVSIGHTAASSALIAEAVDAGARMSTHLGNGCSASLHRHSNILWDQLAEDRLTASIIADGFHLPSAVLKSFLRCKTLDRLVLTCDVSGFGGCPAGRYDSGDLQVDVLSDGRIVVADQIQYLAGSGATTGDCVVHMMNVCGLSPADAWRLGSVCPAARFGEPVGDVNPGDLANLTLFRLTAGTADGQSGNGERPAGFQPVATIVQGCVVGGSL